MCFCLAWWHGDLCLCVTWGGGEGEAYVAHTARPSADEPGGVPSRGDLRSPSLVVWDVVGLLSRLECCATLSALLGSGRDHMGLERGSAGLCASSMWLTAARVRLRRARPRVRRSCLPMRSAASVKFVKRSYAVAESAKASMGTRSSKSSWSSWKMSRAAANTLARASSSPAVKPRQTLECLWDIQLMRENVCRL